MKRLLLIGIFVLGATACKNLKVIEADRMSENKLEKMGNIVDKEGWVRVTHKGESSIQNFSNKAYILTVVMNCSDSNYTPKYLIEFSKDYRDGTYEYVDFTISTKNEFAQINFYVDAVDFGNPFSEFEKENFAVFHQALKSGKLLTISFYSMGMNPETGDDALSLNRSIDFKLANGEFLDIPVDCNVFAQSIAPTEEALDAN